MGGVLWGGGCGAVVRLDQVDRNRVILTSMSYRVTDSASMAGTLESGFSRLREHPEEAPRRIHHGLHKTELSNWLDKGEKENLGRGLKADWGLGRGFKADLRA